ncbi:MAG: hypothetical protein QXG91_03025 [Candidatus Aenigmatarchaeota archaeon]
MLVKKILTILFVTIIPIAFAQPDTDSATVNVQVSSLTAIDINPASFTFSVPPGTNSSALFFQLENIGSTNITTVYSNVTTTTSNPYGTGSASNYNAGEFVRIDNSTNGNFYYVENKNWNESKPLYVTAPSGWSEGNQTGASWGYFVRVRSVGLETNEGEEYFAITRNGTATSCNSGTLYIGKTPHTKSQTGTIDFISGDVAQINLDNNGKGSLTGAGINTIMDSHTVLVSSDCRAVSLIYWKNEKSLIGSTLYPGAAVDMRIMVSVPYGVAQGTITGTLTVIAS